MSPMQPSFGRTATPGWIPGSRLAWRIVLAYATASAIWVSLSAYLLHRVTSIDVVEDGVGVLSGFLFIVITSAVLLVALQRYFSRIRSAGEQVREAEEFSGAVINGLSAHLVVVNEQGDIVACNDAWKRFADDNGLALENSAVGTN